MKLRPVFLRQGNILEPINMKNMLNPYLQLTLLSCLVLTVWFYVYFTTCNFTACNRLDSCDACTKHDNVDFNCRWCNKIGRCSDGLDWYRQHWDRHGCRDVVCSIFTAFFVTKVTLFMVSDVKTGMFVPSLFLYFTA